MARCVRVRPEPHVSKIRYSRGLEVRIAGARFEAGAAKLGIARALLEFNAELRAKLKEAGMLTRDARQHERKKYGQKGARKRFQFSKR